MLFSCTSSQVRWMPHASNTPSSSYALFECLLTFCLHVQVSTIGLVWIRNSYLFIRTLQKTTRLARRNGVSSTLQGGQGHKFEVQPPKVRETLLVPIGGWIHVWHSQNCFACIRELNECRGTEVNDHIEYEHNGAKEWWEHVQVSGIKWKYFYRVLHSWN